MEMERCPGLVSLNPFVKEMPGQRKMCKQFPGGDTWKQHRERRARKWGMPSDPTEVLIHIKGEEEGKRIGRRTPDAVQL